MVDKKIKEEKRLEIREKAKASAKKFHNEFMKSLGTAIIAAFAFLIALVWRDVITVYVDKLSKEVAIQGQLISALLVTIICVIGILLITRITSTQNEPIKI